MAKAAADHLNEISQHLASYEATAPDRRASYSSDTPGWRVLAWRGDDERHAWCRFHTLVIFEDASNHGAIYNVKPVVELCYPETYTYEESRLRPHAMARIKAIQQLFANQ